MPPNLKKKRFGEYNLKDDCAFQQLLLSNIRKLRLNPFKLTRFEYLVFLRLFI